MWGYAGAAALVVLSCFSYASEKSDSSCDKILWLGDIGRYQDSGKEYYARRIRDALFSRYVKTQEGDWYSERLIDGRSIRDKASVTEIKKKFSELKKRYDLLALITQKNLRASLQWKKEIAHFQDAALSCYAIKHEHGSLLCFMKIEQDIFSGMLAETGEMVGLNKVNASLQARYEMVKKMYENSRE